MWSRDGVSIEECKEAPEGLEEGPVGEETDALVAVNTPGPARSQIRAEQAELRQLALGQVLRRVRLIELDRCSVHLQIKISRRITALLHKATKAQRLNKKLLKDHFKQLL